MRPLVLFLALAACSTPDKQDDDTADPQQDDDDDDDDDDTDATGDDDDDDDSDPPLDSDNDGVPDTEDCDPQDPDATVVETWFLDCDGDGVYGDTVDECGAPDACAPDTAPAMTGDCNDLDATGSVEESWYVDCDEDLVFAGPVDNCGAPVDLCDPGVSVTAFSTSPTMIGDCNDLDDSVQYQEDWYIDCDEDAVFRTLPVSSCGAPTAQCASGGDFETSPSLTGDCDDDNPDATEVEDWYIDCDADASFQTAPVSSCGEPDPCAPGPATPVITTDDSVVTGDCDDTDPLRIDVEDWYVDCDGDTAFQQSTQSSCGEPTTCSGTFTPTFLTDGSGLTLGDCNDEDPAAQVTEDHMADCDGDTYFPDTTFAACGTPSDPCSGGALGLIEPAVTLTDVDCDDDESTVHPFATEICGDGIDQDCDTVDPACPIEIDSSDWIRITGENTGDRALPWDVYDLDGDNVDDVIMAAGDAGDGGRVYAVYGPIDASVGLETVPDYYEGPSGSCIGVGRVGTLDAVAGPDFAIYDACRNPYSSWDMGGTLLLSGPPVGATPVTGAFAEIIGPDNRRIWAPQLGNLHGDSLDDVVIDSPRTASNGGTRGDVWVIPSPLSGTVNLADDGTFYGRATHLRMGERTGIRRGDPDGNGYDDLAISSDRFDGDLSNADLDEHGGIVWFDGPITDLTPREAQDNADAAIYGWHRCAKAKAFDLSGDLTGDGENDLLMSAPNGYLTAPPTGLCPTAHDGPGQIYPIGLPVAPGPHLASEVGPAINGSPANTQLHSVKIIGDFNGDCLDDIVAIRHDFTTFTTVLIFLSPLGANLTPDNAAYFYSGEAWLGYSGELHAGDINGDGFSDLLIPNAGYDSFRGAAYVLHGRPDQVGGTPCGG